MSLLKTNPRTMVRMSSLAMAIALLSGRFLQPTAAFPPDATDALKGLLYGLAIGMSLLTVYRVSRSRRDPDAR